MTRVRLNVRKNSAIQPVQVHINHLVIAGWTGRNQAAVNAHIQELAEIGVQPPKRAPTFYRLSASLVTTANCIQTIGSHSSGEAEFVLIHDLDQLLVGVGSDHTDRKAESISVAVAKQMCPKPLGSDVWEFSRIEPHWDELILRSYMVGDNQRVIYQEGSVAAILHPKMLMKQYGEMAGRAFSAGMAMFGGTLPVIGERVPASEFAVELEDPVLKRTLTHTYAIDELPLES